MKHILASLILGLIGCGQNFGPTYDTENGGFPPTDIPHFPDVSGPLKDPVAETDDPEIEENDSIEVCALKIAASRTHAKTFGSASKYYAYQEKWQPGAFKRDIEYLRWLIENPLEAEKFQFGFWREAIDAYQHRKPAMSLVMPGRKIVHATGTHICWSSQAIGYSCTVDNRMYTDCAEAVYKLKEQNCCKFNHPDGVSNQFIPGSCF
jgi:hypothetical protein